MNIKFPSYKFLLVFICVYPFILSSCDDDDNYRAGNKSDLIGNWRATVNSVKATMLVDNFNADIFFDHDLSGLQTELKVTDISEENKIKSIINDSAFFEYFNIKDTLSLTKGDDFYYTLNEKLNFHNGQQEMTLNFKKDSLLRFGDILPTIANLGQQTLQSLLTYDKIYSFVNNEELTNLLLELLKDYNIADSYIKDMKLGITDYSFGLHLTPASTTTQGYIMYKFHLKNILFRNQSGSDYGIDSFLNMFVIPILLNSDSFKDLNNFSLSVNLDLIRK